MKRILFITIFYLLQLAQGQVLYPDLTGQDLIDQLRSDYKPGQVLSYDVARDTMFAIIDNVNSNVSCVYSGYTISIDPAADPSSDAYSKDMNTEHTWPQSMGADAGNARSDLHHLYPARVQVNSSRSNDPFTEISDANTDTWWRLDYSQSTIPGSNIDLFSEKDNTGYFEPRESHKGNVARSMFYFYTMYKEQSDTNFFNQQKETLRIWNLEDAVDQDELDRNQKVAGYQNGKENPFILDTTLVRRAYFSGASGGSDTTSSGENGDVIVTEIMQNPSAVSDTDGEWFEIYNTTAQSIDVNGWYIRDNDTDSHQISNGSSLLIAAHSYLVLGRNANASSNGGVTIAYQYSNVNLGNSGDEIVLFAADGTTEIDRVEYDGGSAWPDPNGASMVFNGQVTDDNNNASNWPVSELIWAGSSGDLGSPGYSDVVADVSAGKKNIPDNFDLQNYPNPFNPATTIRFQLNNRSHVHLKIYNNLGELVTILMDEMKQPGRYMVRFNAEGYGSGIYFAVLMTDSGRQVARMLYLK